MEDLHSISRTPTKSVKWIQSSQHILSLHSCPQLVPLLVSCHLFIHFYIFSDWVSCTTIVDLQEHEQLIRGYAIEENASPPTTTIN